MFNEEASCSSTLTSDNSFHNNFSESLPPNALINGHRKSSLNLPPPDFSGYYSTASSNPNSTTNDHLIEEHLNSYHQNFNNDSFTLPSMHHHHNNYYGYGNGIPHLPLPQHCQPMGSGEDLIATYTATMAAAIGTNRSRGRGQNITNGMASLSQGPTSRKSIFSIRVSFNLIIFSNFFRKNLAPQWKKFIIKFYQIPIVPIFQFLNLNPIGVIL